VHFVRGGTALAAFAAVAVTGLPGPPSSAADVGAYLPSGQTVAVGDVVGRGTAQGDVCAFAEPVRVLLDGTGGLALTATDDCRVVVSAVTGDPPDDALAVGLAMPAVRAPGDVLATSRSGTFLGGTATSGTDPVAEKVGTVWQWARDARGAWQAQSYFQVSYGRNLRTGEVSDPKAGWGACTANTYPTGVGLVTDVLLTTAPTSCYWSVVDATVNRFELRGFGAFSHRTLTMEDARFTLDASFYALRGTGDDDFGKECAMGIMSGTWPRGWTRECYATEEDGVQ
jgi:hypothetical protein